MSLCDPRSCEHFMALSIVNGNLLAVQHENIDLKRQILVLQSEKSSSTSREDNYYQRWLELNKENQDLTSRLSNSKRMVAELQPRLNQVMKAVQNIEYTLDLKKQDQNEDVSRFSGAKTTNRDNHSHLSADREESNCQEKDPIQEENSKEKSRNSKTKVPECLKERSEGESRDCQLEDEENDADEATDIEDDVTSTSAPEATSYSEQGSSAPNQDSVSKQSCSEIIPHEEGHMPGYQNLPEEKPVFAECSICHQNFQHILKPELKMFQGPPCCDKCKLPPTTTSRGITFQYPKGSSSVSASKEDSSYSHIDYLSNELASQYSTHVDDKPYQCQMCGKKFTRSHGLTKHIRIHTGEKPYTCKICGKRFAVSGRLALHIRIHTGEKPYECKFCGKRFNESSKLKIHYRRHTGEKPFTCEVCDKGFSQMSTLTAHCRRHLTETRHKCGKCGNGFRNPNALRGHRCLQICDSTLELQNRTETILGDD